MSSILKRLQNLLNPTTVEPEIYSLKSIKHVLKGYAFLKANNYNLVNNIKKELENISYKLDDDNYKIVNKPVCPLCSDNKNIFVDKNFWSILRIFQFEETIKKGLKIKKIICIYIMSHSNFIIEIAIKSQKIQNNMLFELCNSLMNHSNYFILNKTNIIIIKVLDCLLEEATILSSPSPGLSPFISFNDIGLFLKVV